MNDHDLVLKHIEAHGDLSIFQKHPFRWWIDTLDPCKQMRIDLHYVFSSWILKLFVFSLEMVLNMFMHLFTYYIYIYIYTHTHIYMCVYSFVDTVTWLRLKVWCPIGCPCWGWFVFVHHIPNGCRHRVFSKRSEEHVENEANSHPISSHIIPYPPISSHIIPYHITRPAFSYVFRHRKTLGASPCLRKGHRQAAALAQRLLEFEKEPWIRPWPVAEGFITY